MSAMRRCLFFLLLAVICGICHGAARPWALLFGERECLDCEHFKQDWQDEFTSPDDPVLVFLPVDEGDNYDFLRLAEKKLEITDKRTGFPVFIVGRKCVDVTEGFDAVVERLPELLKDLPEDGLFTDIAQAAANAGENSLITFTKTLQPMVASSADAAVSSAGKSDDISPAAAKTTIREPRLLFFEQPGCRKCSRQQKEFELLRRILPDIRIDAWDITTMEGQAMLSRARKAFAIPETDTKNLAPMVVWAEGYATGRLAEAAELAEALRRPLTGNEFWLTAPTPEEVEAEERRLDTFVSALTLWSVISGGLADGINPCAFATSVFLISYLLYLGRRRREILLVGGCFCLGVFVTYYLFGLALSAIISQIHTWQWAKTVLYLIFACVGFVLCGLHLRDAVRYRRTGRVSDMDMGLSRQTHRNIHEKIRRFTSYRSWLLVPAAIVLGAIVSAMELACTGQVYLPVLTALAERGINVRFLWLLFLYNLLFILPLAVITVLAANGIGSKALERWGRDHVFATKVTMAGLFVLLGGLMVLLAFR